MAMKILVPSAGTEPAKENVRYIVDIAKKLGAEILALHIVAPGDQTTEEEVFSVFTKEAQKSEVPVWKLLWKGEVVPTIINVAQKEGVDLIVMGASEGRVVADWVSSDVVGKSGVPVVVIPHEYCKAIR